MKKSLLKKSLLRKRLYLFDTTLRDGAQTHGITMTQHHKESIAGLLDPLVDYIEGGFPGANPIDTNFFADPPPLHQARLVAFGMTQHGKQKTSSLSKVLSVNAPVVCLVAKAWDFHVEKALRISLEENLDAISHSVSLSKKANKEVIIDAEHFFDGYKANPSFALKCLDVALKQGARWVVLCDTTGGTLPREISTIIHSVGKHIPLEQVGIHAHNDTGNAVANTLAAVEAGVCQVQGTLNGLGERCGNANLCSVIPTLVYKKPFCDTHDFPHISKDRLKNFASVAHQAAEIIGTVVDPYAPYVGKNAFAHKAGIHASAMLRDTRTYEHIPPNSVGNKRLISLSAQGGRSNVKRLLTTLSMDQHLEDEALSGGILTLVKEKEQSGYTYDTALASLELLIRTFLGEDVAFFRVERFEVRIEGSSSEGETPISEACLQVEESSGIHNTKAIGDGPVHAIDQALRAGLPSKKSILENIRLVDYKVRLLKTEKKTAAVTHIMIESENHQGDRWFTVGVSPNIIQASLEALSDAYRYGFLKHTNR